MEWMESSAEIYDAASQMFGVLNSKLLDEMVTSVVSKMYLKWISMSITEYVVAFVTTSTALCGARDATLYCMKSER